METTGRLERVIISQRRLMYWDLLATFAVMSSVGAYVLAMF